MALHARHGFSLIEMLIVIGILIAVAGLTLPYLQSFQTKSDARTHADAITHALRRAQQFARSGQASSGWGVYVDTSVSEYTLYRGTTYAGRDASYDQTASYSDSVTLATSYGNDVSFAIFSGLATASGTVAVTDINGDSYTVMITAYGAIKQAE